MSLARRAVGSVWGLAWRWMAAAQAAQSPGCGGPPRLRVGNRNQPRACVYCGDLATTVDHLRPVLQAGGLPSGYGSDAWNCVPSCATCNCSKGNRHWRTFMTRTTGKAPLARGVHPTTNSWRMARLQAFEHAGERVIQSRRWAVHQHAAFITNLRRQLESLLSSFEANMMRMRSRVRDGSPMSGPETGTGMGPSSGKGGVWKRPAVVVSGWRASLRLRRLRQRASQAQAQAQCPGSVP